MFAAGFRRQDGYSEGQRRVALAAWAASAFVFVSVATLLLVAQVCATVKLLFHLVWFLDLQFRGK